MTGTWLPRSAVVGLLLAQVAGWGCFASDGREGGRGAMEEPSLDSLADQTFTVTTTGWVWSGAASSSWDVDLSSACGVASGDSFTVLGGRWPGGEQRLASFVVSYVANGWRLELASDCQDGAEMDITWSQLEYLTGVDLAELLGLERDVFVETADGTFLPGDLPDAEAASCEDDGSGCGSESL